MQTDKQTYIRVGYQFAQETAFAPAMNKLSSYDMTHITECMLCVGIFLSGFNYA